MFEIRDHSYCNLYNRRAEVSKRTGHLVGVFLYIKPDERSRSATSENKAVWVIRLTSQKPTMFAFTTRALQNESQTRRF